MVATGLKHFQGCVTTTGKADALQAMHVTSVVINSVLEIDFFDVFSISGGVFIQLKRKYLHSALYTRLLDTYPLYLKCHRILAENAKSVKIMI